VRAVLAPAAVHRGCCAVLKASLPHALAAGLRPSVRPSVFTRRPRQPVWIRLASLWRTVGCDRWTLWDAARHGRIRAEKIDRRWWVEVESLATWLLRYRFAGRPLAGRAWRVKELRLLDSGLPTRHIAALTGRSRSAVKCRRWRRRTAYAHRQRSS